MEINNEVEGGNEEQSQSNESVNRSLSGDLFSSTTSNDVIKDQPSKTSGLDRFKPVLGGLEFSEEKSKTEALAQSQEIKNLKGQLEHLQIQFTEFVKANQFKFDRVVKNLRSMEQIQSHHRQEIAIHYAELSGKLKERKIQENKVSDLIDRHNQIVNGFELRLSQLKKSFHERELKFMQVTAALEDAQREIERLKRN